MMTNLDKDIREVLNILNTGKKSVLDNEAMSKRVLHLRNVITNLEKQDEQKANQICETFIECSPTTAFKRLWKWKNREFKLGDEKSHIAKIYENLFRTICNGTFKSEAISKDFVGNGGIEILVKEVHSDQAISHMNEPLNQSPLLSVAFTLLGMFSANLFTMGCMGIISNTLLYESLHDDVVKTLQDMNISPSLKRYLDTK